MSDKLLKKRLVAIPASNLKTIMISGVFHFGGWAKLHLTDS
jgi:hypothetical protein